MRSNRHLSLIAAFALSAATGGAARAAPVPTSTDETREMTQSPTDAEIEAGEVDNPHSTDYADRMDDGKPVTNGDINAAESGSPDSIGNKDQAAPPSNENWRADWQREESEDPDSH